MSGRRSHAFPEVATGIFMLAVLAVLVYFTVVISGVDLVFGRERRRLDVTFEQVGGLKEHDSVMYRGTKVGTVERIALSPTNLTVTIEIDKSVVLRENGSASVRSLSLLGGNYLELDEGTGKPLDLDSSAHLKGEPPADWMRDVSQVARNLNRLTGQAELSEIVTNLLVTTEKVRILAERLEHGEGLLGKLMSPDDTLYADVKKTFANASEASDDFRKIASNAVVLTERMKNGEGTIGKLMTSDVLHDDLLASVDAFRKACDSLDLGDAKADVKDVVASAKTMVANLSTVAERLKDGKGTLGKLAADEEMYNEVNGLIRDVRQMIDNYRDTTPISTFSSLATGAL